MDKTPALANRYADTTGLHSPIFPLVALLLSFTAAPAQAVDFNTRQTWQLEKAIPFQVCIRWNGQQIPFAPAEQVSDDAPADVQWNPPHGISDIDAERLARRGFREKSIWDGASHDYFLDEKEGIWFAWDQGVTAETSALPGSYCVEWETRYEIVRYGTADVYRADNNVRKTVVLVAPYKLTMSSQDSPAWSAGELYDELEDRYGVLQALISEGYDPIVYRYQSPNDGIAYNAKGLELLLNRLRDTGSATDIAVIGLSMGGVVARYALAHMDHYNIPHKVRVYISYDAPHKGVNIPYSLDHDLRRLKDKLNKDYVKLICDATDNDDCKDARRDVNRFVALLDTKTLEELVPIPREGTTRRQTLMANLQQIGMYPRRIPSYALSNGTATITQGYPQQDNVFRFRLNLLVAYTFDIEYNLVDYLDNAPGSRTPGGNLFGELGKRVHAMKDTLPISWISGDQNGRPHSFIPSASAVPDDNPWGWNGLRYSLKNSKHMNVGYLEMLTVLAWLESHMQPPPSYPHLDCNGACR